MIPIPLSAPRLDRELSLWVRSCLRCCSHDLQSSRRFCSLCQQSEDIHSLLWVGSRTDDCWVVPPRSLHCRWTTSEVWYRSFALRSWNSKEWRLVVLRTEHYCGRSFDSSGIPFWLVAPISICSWSWFLVWTSWYPSRSRQDQWDRPGIGPSTLAHSLLHCMDSTISWVVLVPPFCKPVAASFSCSFRWSFEGFSAAFLVVSFVFSTRFPSWACLISRQQIGCHSELLVVWD